jgi:hypothetical protein
MDTGGLYQIIKRPKREIHYLPQSSAEVENTQSFTTTSSHFLMKQCLSTGIIVSLRDEYRFKMKKWTITNQNLIQEC